MTNIAYKSRRTLPRSPLSLFSLLSFSAVNSCWLSPAKGHANWTQDTDTDTTTSHMAITVRAAYDAASLVVPLPCLALPYALPLPLSIIV